MWSQVIVLKLPVRRTVHPRHDALNGCRLEIPLSRWQSAGEVTISTEHTNTRITGSESATVAHITVSAHQLAFPTNRIRYAHDAVVERVTATVHSVELGLRRVLIHVDDEEEQLTLGSQLFQLEVTRSHWSVRVAAAATAVAAISCRCGCGWCRAVET